MVRKEKSQETGNRGTIDRRSFFSYFASLGLAGAAFPAALQEKAEEKGAITLEVVKEAEKVAGLEFTDGEREMMLEGLNDLQESYKNIRALGIGNEVPPALYFNPLLPGMEVPRRDAAASRKSAPAVKRPADDAALAFMTLTELSELFRARQVTSLELTRLYLERLKKYDPVLKCVVSLTEERALREAEDADREFAAGRYRGPLHGLPWGAKDLLATRGCKTTWGAAPYKDQEFDYDAAVVERLTGAGAVLVAKLTLGALAMGDYWYGGQTKNPWDTEQGSSGSSAGPAVAAAAGLAGFTIGSETWGSIVSPSNRCGATGLRPTFGRVSRHGAMALSWSMDKLGPLCRSVEDCALVLDAIHGPDGKDLSVVAAPFAWDSDLDISKLRIGYTKSLFEEEPREGQEEWHGFDLKTLETMESLGIELIPIELPDFPVGSLSFLLGVEAAAAFDELTLSGRDDLLTRQTKNSWPNAFRQSRMVPAVEYVQANRARTLLMQKMAAVMKAVDVYVCPSYGGDNLLLTNLTGHPCVVLPNGFRKEKGTPTSITFIGDLFAEDRLLAVARAYQEATDFHLRRPRLD